MEELILILILSMFTHGYSVLEQFDEDNIVKSTILFNLMIQIPDKASSKLQIICQYYSEHIRISNMAKNLIDDYDLRINKAATLPVFGRFMESFINYLGLDMSDVEDEASPLDNIIVRMIIKICNSLLKNIILFHLDRQSMIY